MSDVSSDILFEHPLNEKMRTWLRVEFLLQQLYHYHTLTSITETLNFFRLIHELLDVLERGEIRIEMLKELERQQKKLQGWTSIPGADIERITTLVQELNSCTQTLAQAPRLGQEVKEDKLISLVRQRLTIPGGCCSFDLPALHMWLHLDQTNKNQQIELWLNTLHPLHQALTQLLELVRHSGTFKSQISLNGFFQDTTDNADLLRINLPLELQLYPQISGHKTRYAIRFLPLDSEHGKVPERLNFTLACC